MPTQSSSSNLSRLAVAASIAALSLSATAADKYKWDNNGGDNRIANGDNWYLDGSDPKVYGAPTVDTECEYSTGGTIFLLEGETFTAKNINFGNWGSAATIDITNGTFTVADDVTIGRYGQNAKFNIFDGDVTVKRFNVGHWLSHDNNTLNIYGGNITLTGEGSPWPATLVLGLQTESRGDMLVKGGTVIVNGGVRVGFSNLMNIGGPSPDYNSSLTVDGGSLSASGTIAVADSDSVGGGGRVYVKSGSLSTTGDLNISVTSNSWGQVDVTGGALTVNGTVRVGNHTYAQHAAFNVSDGVVNSGGLNIGASAGVDGSVTITGGAWTNDVNSLSIGAAGGAVGSLTVNGGEFSSKKMLNIGNSGGSGRLTVGGTGVFRDDSSGDNYVHFNGADGLLRLNEGGKFYFRAILDGTKGTVEFNGGEMIKSTQSAAYGVSGTAIESKYTIEILAGGMIFNSDYTSTCKAAMVCADGCGGITKRGSGELNFNNQSFKYLGPIYVEGGTLTFSGNNQFPDFVDVIRVAEGATLVLPHDVTCRVLENNGTIQGGTVTVESDAATKVATRAVWTGAMEDGDVLNAKNYIVYDQNDRVMYEQTITTDTPVVVPFMAGVPSFVGFSDVTWVIEDDTRSEGYSRPAALKAVLDTVAVWYDPSDTDSLTVTDGKVTEMMNKGTIKADVGQQVDLDLEQRDTGKTASSLSVKGFNGRQSIYFDGTSGFKSKGNFPADFPANGGRTMFVVAQGDVSSMIMFMISQGRQNKEEGRSMLLAHKNDSHIYGTGYKYGYSTDGGANWSAGKVTFDAVQSNAPYVFAGLTAISSGDERTVTSFAMGKDGESIGSTNNVSMPAGEQGARFNTYYGSFELSAYSIYKDTNGYQGEALIFTNALSDAEMDAVNAYLKAKWLDPLVVMPDFDSLVVNAEIDLGGATRTFEKLSGSGSFVDGTVVLNGDLIVTVNPDQSVVAPSFDKLVLGENARLVVNGAKNLPTKGTINILSFASLQGEFKSVVGDRNTRVILRYLEDHVCARRDAGMIVTLR